MALRPLSQLACSTLAVATDSGGGAKDSPAFTMVKICAALIPPSTRITTSSPTTVMIQRLAFAPIFMNPRAPCLGRAVITTSTPARSAE